ncbi:hypothetical protein EV122DRAFT_285560 [Schizophyllum commune]
MRIRLDLSRPSPIHVFYLPTRSRRRRYRPPSASLPPPAPFSLGVAAHSHIHNPPRRSTAPSPPPTALRRHRATRTLRTARVLHTALPTSRSRSMCLDMPRVNASSSYHDEHDDVGCARRRARERVGVIVTMVTVTWHRTESAPAMRRRWLPTTGRSIITTQPRS